MGGRLKTKRTYVIWNPVITRRNGSRVLQRLAIALHDEGCDVFRFAFNAQEEASDGIPILSKRDITSSLRENAVVVYPEVVAGNPLRIRNVVRWVLFYPGLNGGNFRYHKGDVIFAFMPQFFPGAPLLSPPWLDARLFYRDGRARDVDCCFVHKGGRWRIVPETKGLRVITMYDPPTREALADLLRSTRVLYSFDDCSSVLDEAQMCGAEVKVVTKDGFRDYESPHPRVVKEFPAQLEHFMDVTSQMNWQGELETRLQWRAWLNSLWLFGIKPMILKLV